MSKIQQMLDAGLPLIVEESDESLGRYSFAALSDEQSRIYVDIVNPPTPQQLAARARKAEAFGFAKSIPNFATWTQAQFQVWCDGNLMTDAQIDASNISAALKTNIKANNQFTRNGIKFLIALRDEIWPTLPEE